MASTVHFVLLMFHFLALSFAFNPMTHLSKRLTPLAKPVKRYAEVGENELCFTLEGLEAVKENFRKSLDLNNDGKASKQEVTNYLRKFDPGVSKSQVKQFIRRRDLNDNGVIDLIPDYIVEIKNPDTSEAGAREWFTLEDVDKDGMISKGEIQKIGSMIGLQPHEIEDTQQYYSIGDKNKDGLLTWDEYKDLYGR